MNAFDHISKPQNQFVLPDCCIEAFEEIRKQLRDAGIPATNLPEEDELQSNLIFLIFSSEKIKPNFVVKYSDPYLSIIRSMLNGLKQRMPLPSSCQQIASKEAKKHAEPQGRNPNLIAFWEMIGQFFK